MSNDLDMVFMRSTLIFWNEILKVAKNGNHKNYRKDSMANNNSKSIDFQQKYSV